MAKRVHHHPNLIFSAGTHVVALRDVVGQNGRTLHPRGSVGVVVKWPSDLEQAFEDSRLPERPSCADALNDLLVRLRMGCQ